MVLYGVSPRVQALLIRAAPVKGAEWYTEMFFYRLYFSMLQSVHKHAVTTCGPLRRDRWPWLAQWL